MILGYVIIIAVILFRTSQIHLLTKLLGHTNETIV